MAALVMIGSATHYLGWPLVAAFVIALGIVSALKISGDEGMRTFRWSDIAATLGISLVFPIAWTIANQVKFGDAFHFLSQAYAYHGQFAAEPLVTRLEAILAALWKAEPLVVGLALPALIQQAIRHRQRLIFASPALVYLAILSLVGILGEAVPDLHPRYVLIAFWLVAPLISMSVMEIGQSVLPYSMLIPIIVAIGVPTSGVLRSLNFHNWMDPVAREATTAIQDYVDRATEPLKVYVEPHTCLYPTAGIANSISRPDWVNNFYDPDATPPTSNSESYDLALLVDPLDIRSYAQSHRVVAEVGSYVLFADGQGSTLSALSGQPPSNWAPITNEQFLYVSPGGTPFFAFDQASTSRGSAVGMETVEDVQPNGCQIISADVEDWYHANDQPWVVLQQLVVNGVVLWSHDVGASGSCIQQIDNYLMPTTNRLTIQIRAVAIGSPQAPSTLQGMSLTGVRNLSLHACD
jgi:hypothetical protein